MLKKLPDVDPVYELSEAQQLELVQMEAAVKLLKKAKFNPRIIKYWVAKAEDPVGVISLS